MTTLGDDAARASQAAKLDYKAIGFRCGLEIHQQLATRKLFSPCPSDVVEPDDVARRTVATVERVLRATGSELGEVDAAAAAEARRNRRFRYLVMDGLSSLVELDEEPPHPMSTDALDVALTFAGLVAGRPVDEVHVMRKTVIDGSNTSGFQRTALIATGGKLDVEGGDVGIWTMALEEDSARKLEGEADVVTYTLDRLGIPLLEVATAPDIVDPQHAQRAAARIGALLRATGRVKRGLGTIRQDLNVSVGVGARVEIKGCQDLRAIPRIIEAECRRQLWMHHVREELKRLGGAKADVPHDVTAALAATTAKVVRESLQRGAVVMGVRLQHGAGLLKGATKDGPRLGRELADHAKVSAGVKGIFHSDELPGYGITQAEVDAVRQLLGCGAADAFALCVEKPAIARMAVAAAAARYVQAASAFQQEVRAVQPDDSTRFMRPMPGAARMYPETDVPPILVSAATWKDVKGRLPPKPEEKVALFVKANGVSKDIAQQLVADGMEAEFQELVQAGAEGPLAARVLLQYLPELKTPDAVLAHLPGMFAALRAGKFAKEAIPDILKALDAGEKSLDAAMAKAGAGSLDAAAVDAVIAKVIAERVDFVKAKGMAAIGPLMGPVMAELRGKADGQLISARLKAALEKVAH
ncbi:MAG: Glu-tRNA(Gln) amidotransferase subunit GatE [bacterium]